MPIPLTHADITSLTFDERLPASSMSLRTQSPRRPDRLDLTWPGRESSIADSRKKTRTPKASFLGRGQGERTPKGEKVSRRLVFRRVARIEFDEAFDWYEQKRKGLGLDFKSRVQGVLDRIVATPEMYPTHYRDAQRALNSPVILIG